MHSIVIKQHIYGRSSRRQYAYVYYHDYYKNNSSKD